MNSTLSLIAVAGALACGLTLARPSTPPQDREPLERIEDLEKEVKALKLELAGMRKAPGKADGTLTPEEALRADVEQLIRWVQAQGPAADALNRAMEESRAKGFTAGINPDSRVVLLSGFGELTTALKTPLQLSANQTKPGAAAKPTEARAAQR